MFIRRSKHNRLFEKIGFLEGQVEKLKGVADVKCFQVGVCGTEKEIRAHYYRCGEYGYYLFYRNGVVVAEFTKVNYIIEVGAENKK